MKQELYNIGVERESLRCDENGNLALTPHPELFGDRMKNDFITTDFGEAQMELRTPVCKNSKECHEKLEEITNVVLEEIRKNGEMLWSYSMPCILPDEEHFVFGNYGDDVAEHEYEMALYRKYGYRMHCISGIHVNFSFQKVLFEKIKRLYPNVPKKLDDAYFKIIRTFMKKAWILMYCLGATPIQLEDNDKSTLSLRNSNKHGFGNGKQLQVDFTNKEKYIESIEAILNSGNVLSAREIYIPIRAKTHDKNNVLEELKKQTINHIEVRLIDINPFDKCGISKEDLDLTVIFLVNCLVDEDNYELNYKEVAEKGLNEEQRQILVKEIEKYRKLNKELNLECEDGIEEAYNMCINNTSKAKQIEEMALAQGLKNTILKISKEYSDQAYQERYTIKSHPKLETATMALIKDAISQGVDYNIINEGKSFIELTHGHKKEYIIQATKTSRDSYIFPYITDDKYFAKEIMKENGISVPKGIMINKEMSESEKEELISTFYESPVVVKPRTTNCGVGITVFAKPVSPKDLKKAVRYAFKFDEDILLEEYAQGKEYRFVAIDGKVLSVVHRRSASVVGDGESTISTLIGKKQNEEWHYLLRKHIKIDEPLEEFLSLQGLSLDYVPPKGERVFLRKNSNVSTGGESVDVTDIMPEKFKKIAEKMAKAFNSKICGVDIIIDDLEKDEYTMIEINDNPGISINEWPYEGKGRKIGLDILKLLKLI